MAVAEFGQMPRYDLEKTRQNERNDQDADDARHLMTNEVKSVIAPAAEHLENALSSAMREYKHGWNSCSAGSGVLLGSESDFRVADDGTSGKVASVIAGAAGI
jgi:hypothetical protein